jgi:NAD(P)-dependent dehydrogenase (short-subunit alcohol dehydrogenase family)
MSSIADFDLDTWQKVLNTNLTSSFLLTKYLSPLMEDSENPRIIFTSSGVAKKGRAFWGAYSISKAAVKSLSEILQEELEPISKIKVFNFDPGATRTSMRAYAYPAENPSNLKDASSLLDYYLWFFSTESANQDNRYIEFNKTNS